MGHMMDTTTRCTRCGKRMIGVINANGRTELQCIRCDKVDPLRSDTAKWADAPLLPPK
jgi:phage FluMu protein Com